MFLYKNPGLKKIIRFKCHNWGVQTLESIIKKEIELKERLNLGKEKIMEQKTKIMEKGEKIKEKVITEKEKLKEKVIHDLNKHGVTILNKKDSTKAS